MPITIGTTEDENKGSLEHLLQTEESREGRDRLREGISQTMLQVTECKRDLLRSPSGIGRGQNLALRGSHEKRSLIKLRTAQRNNVNPSATANVGMGLQTRPKRTDLKVRPYSLETREMPRQWVERVQLILLCFSCMYN
jgi:hypothetical protein